MSLIKDELNQKASEYLELWCKRLLRLIEKGKINAENLFDNFCQVKIIISIAHLCSLDEAVILSLNHLVKSMVELSCNIRYFDLAIVLCQAMFDLQKDNEWNSLISEITERLPEVDDHQDLVVDKDGKLIEKPWVSTCTSHEEDLLQRYKGILHNSLRTSKPAFKTQYKKLIQIAELNEKKLDFIQAAHCYVKAYDIAINHLSQKQTTAAQQSLSLLFCGILAKHENNILRLQLKYLLDRHRNHPLYEHVPILESMLMAADYHWYHDRLSNAFNCFVALLEHLKQFQEKTHSDLEETHGDPEETHSDLDEAVIPLITLLLEQLRHFAQKDNPRLSSKRLKKLHIQHDWLIARKNLTKYRRMLSESLAAKPATKTLSLIAKYSEQVNKLLEKNLDKFVLQLGMPPYEFTLLSLGSLARKEFCHHSDLEFALLQGNKNHILIKSQEYFDTFFEVFKLFIISLGETSFDLALPEKKMVFNLTKNGLCFDLATTVAAENKAYFGTIEEFTARIINEMGRDNFTLLPNLMITCDFLYSSTGVKDHYNAFKKSIKDNTSKDLKQKFAVNLMKLAINDFKPDNNLDRPTYNIKKGLLRFPVCFITALCCFYNIEVMSNKENCQNLCEAKIISPIVRVLLQYWLNFSYNLRLRAHYNSGYECDEVLLHDDKNNLDTNNGMLQLSANEFEQLSLLLEEIVARLVDSAKNWLKTTQKRLDTNSFKNSKPVPIDIKLEHPCILLQNDGVFPIKKMQRFVTLGLQIITLCHLDTVDYNANNVVSLFNYDTNKWIRELVELNLLDFKLGEALCRFVSWVLKIAQSARKMGNDVVYLYSPEDNRPEGYVLNIKQSIRFPTLLDNILTPFYEMISKSLIPSLSIQHLSLKEKTTIIEALLGKHLVSLFSLKSMHIIPILFKVLIHKHADLLEFNYDFNTRLINPIEKPVIFLVELISNLDHIFSSIEPNTHLSILTEKYCGYDVNQIFEKLPPICLLTIFGFLKIIEDENSIEFNAKQSILLDKVSFSGCIDALDKNPELVLILLTIVMKSKHNKQLGFLSSISISIINSGRFSLSGLDLSDVFIQGANLNNAILTYTDLSRANCQRVNFSGALLDYADLSCCNLDHIQFNFSSKNNMIAHCPNAISSLAFSHNCKRLASGDVDGTVRQWDVSSGKCLIFHESHNGLISCLSYNRRGTLLASGSFDCTIREWHTDTAECLNTTQHNSWISCVSYSPDGVFLAAGSWDNMVQQWKVDDRNNRMMFQGHTRPITNVCYDPNTTRLASVSKDAKIYVWNVTDGRRLLVLKGKNLIFDGIEQPLWNITGVEDNLVQLTDNNNIITVTGSHWGSITKVKVSLNNYLAVAYDNNIETWRPLVVGETTRYLCHWRTGIHRLGCKEALLKGVVGLCQEESDILCEQGALVELDVDDYDEARKLIGKVTIDDWLIAHGIESQVVQQLQSLLSRPTQSEVFDNTQLKSTAMTTTTTASVPTPTLTTITASTTSTASVLAITSQLSQATGEEAGIDTYQENNGEVAAGTLAASSLITERKKDRTTGEEDTDASADSSEETPHIKQR